MVGKALYLDGTQKFTMPAFDFKLGDSFTISFYTCIPMATGGFNVLFSKGSKDAGHIEIYVTGSGTISFYQQEIGIHDSTAFVTDNYWHHIVYTYDGTTLNGFVDGNEIYSYDISVRVKNDKERITIGCFEANGETHYYLNGAIDELKIFNRVLGKEELGVN